MKRFLGKLWADKDGATAIEYGLLVAAISIAALIAMSAFGGSLQNIYDTISGSIDDEVGQAQGG